MGGGCSKIVKFKDGPTDTISQASYDGYFICGGHYDTQYLTVRRADNGGKVLYKHKLENSVTGLAVGEQLKTESGEPLLIAADENGYLNFYDLKSGNEIRKSEKVGFIGISAIGVSPDGKLIAYIGGGECIGLVTVADGKKVWEKTKVGNGNANVVRFTPDGSHFVVADRKGSVSFWPADPAATEAPEKAAKRVCAAPGEDSEFPALSVLEFSADGKRFVAGGRGAYIFDTDCADDAKPVAQLSGSHTAKPAKKLGRLSIPTNMLSSAMWTAEDQYLIVVHHESPEGPDVCNAWKISSGDSKAALKVVAKELKNSEGRMYSGVWTDAKKRDTLWFGCDSSLMTIDMKKMLSS